MPHPTPIGKKHEAFELGRESMHPGEIAVRVGAAPKTLIAFSCGELPLLVWNQGSKMSSFKDHSPLRMCTLQNGPWRLGGWGIRMGCMLAVRRSTTNRLVAMSQGHSTGVPNHPMCSWIGTSMTLCFGTSCGTPWYHLQGSVLKIVTDYQQQEDITKMDQPTQSPDCNPI